LTNSSEDRLTAFRLADPNFWELRFFVSVFVIVFALVTILSLFPEKT